MLAQRTESGEPQPELDDTEITAVMDWFGEFVQVDQAEAGAMVVAEVAADEAVTAEVPDAF